MFYRVISEDFRVALTQPQHADELFALTERNRAHLEAWLPWLGATRRVSDTLRFIEANLASLAKGTALSEVLVYRGRIAGVLGFNSIDKANGVGHIGYWLGEDYTGKGLMTLAVADLIDLGFQEFGLQRMEIRCSTENHRSRAIPERLGFKQEGTLRSVEKAGEKLHSHAVYGLLHSEYSGRA
ncbi:MAG: GNAT family protein [Halomonas sp.]|nr:GNAT family protein [Halomonas sp.]